MSRADANAASPPLDIARLDSAQPDFSARLQRLLSWEAEEAAVGETVRAIVADVRARGDAALLEHTRRLDRVSASSVAELELSSERLHQALRAIDPAQRQALQTAAERLRAYAEHQGLAAWDYREANGTRLGQKVTALERVGLYVPGGKAAYPSSLLMGAAPARVAGVGELVMVVPTPDGVVQDLVLAAAAIVGVDRVFAVGGAQAVAALAYGTETIARVDKIVGPGNAYVAAAKRQVFGTVGIDMLAGPSEVLVVCDGHTQADWVAMDLFAQAEHDEDARAMLLCPDARFIDAVVEAMARLIREMPRAEIIRAALATRGALIQVADLDEAMRLANHIAPEHLELSVAEPEPLLSQVRHAGAVFVGPYSAEVLGDYCAGPNHVLPTSRSARFSSPLGVYDFQKRISVIDCSTAGAAELAPTAAALARGEGLVAHARSAEYRLAGGE